MKEIKVVFRYHNVHSRQQKLILQQKSSERERFKELVYNVKENWFPLLSGGSDDLIRKDPPVLVEKLVSELICEMFCY